MNSNFDSAFKSKPKALMCYICGREYGTKSLEIHIKTCIQKWEIEENKKPKKERRPLPQPPKQLGNLLDKGEMGMKEIEEYNGIANDQWNKDTLIRCEFCNRTFLEHRIPGHKKICTAEKPFKPLNKPNANEEKYDSPTINNKGYSPEIGGKKQAGGGGGGGGYDSMPIKKQALGGGQSESMPVKKINQVGGGQSNNNASIRPNNNPIDNLPIKKGGGMPPQMENFEDEADLELEPCPICGRNFASNRLAKHTTICQKSKAKQKKLEEQGVIHKPAKPEKPNKSKKSEKDGKWKKQHEELVNAMKYMRQVKKAEESGDFSKVKPPPSNNYDDYVQCPYCGRKYNEQVAERHIPKCKDIINKPKPPPTKVSQSSSPYKISNPVSNNYQNKNQSNFGGNPNPGNYGASKTNFGNQNNYGYGAANNLNNGGGMGANYGGGVGYGGNYAGGVSSSNYKNNNSNQFSVKGNSVGQVNQSSSQGNPNYRKKF